ncbi:UNVERIFIED_CONTAM: hypothetical protein FKN15_069997 [Acipenser sinensis]
MGERAGVGPVEREPEREPTELELLLQKWEQAGEAPLSPVGVELPSREPEGMRKLPPPQPRPPPLKTSPVLPAMIPYPLLLDTLPVCLDLPALDLEPRSLHHQPQFHTWFPTPLSPITQTSLGCCQASLMLPLFAASLPLGDRTSLHGPQVKTSARCCSLRCPGHRCSRLCHPGGVPCRRAVVPPWQRRRDRPTLKPARGSWRRFKKSDLRVGGLLRVE